MATARPFAYNTGAPIAGTDQLGALAIGTPTVGFIATGLEWWNGPDEELGYVIACQVPTDVQPTPVELTWDPNYVGVGNTLSVGNTVVTNSGVNSSVLAGRLFGAAEKVMFSIKINQTTNGEIGAGQHGMNLGSYVGSGDGKSVGFSSDGKYYYYGGDQGVLGLPTWGSVNDIVDIAVNMAAGLIYIRVNGGNWNGTLNENPASGGGSIAMGGLTNLYPAMTPYQGIATILETSTYSVPSGFTFLGQTLASVGFFRSSDLTEGSFISLSDYIAGPSGGGPFTSGANAKTWLNANGYWTSYAGSSATLIMNLNSTLGISGSSWSDQSGYSNNATLNGGYGTTTYNGNQVVTFNGTNAYVFPSGGFGTNLDSGFTYEIWAYPTTTSNGTIIAEWGGAPPNGWNDAQIAFVSGTINAGVFPNAFSPDPYLIGPSFSVNTWYNIVMTYDDISGDLNLYINGSLSGTTNGTKSNPGGTYLTLGRPDIANSYLGGATNYFQGYIGSWKIWDGPISGASVLANYNASKSRFGL